MKTSRLKAIALGLLTLSTTAYAEMNRFECLRGMLQIDDRGYFQARREGFESPFTITDKYIVFPEVGADKVLGFMVYDSRHAWYYDAVKQQDGSAKMIVDLKPDSTAGILDLTAQPNGLETISIPYLPNYNPHSSDHSGPVILGSSVLPVVGAFVSRPKQRDLSYFDPNESTERELSQWMASHSVDRRSPAGVEKSGPLTHTIVKLTTVHPKSQAQAWAPVDYEIKLRREWIKTHNIDEQMFKKISKVIEGCEEKP